MSFQCYNIIHETKHIIFFTNSEEAYNIPFSEKTFHHALTLTNETGTKNDQITNSMKKNSM